MNKSKLSPYTKTLLLICVLLTIMSCVMEHTPEYFILIVTATPVAEVATGPAIGATPTPPVNIEPLKVIWLTTPNCAGGKLKGATVELRISGGVPPYKVSPSSPFAISDGNDVKITVKSQDNQTFEAYVPPPTCENDSVKDSGEGDESPPLGGSTLPPGGETPVPTINPTFHPPTP